MKNKEKTSRSFRRFNTRGKNYIKAVLGLFWKDMRTNKTKNEINDVKKWKSKIKREDLQYETKSYIYDFQQYDTIRSFVDNIYTGKISIDEA